jgi:hypothetical protein
VADVGRLRALGFAPAYALRDTLAELWDYYTGVVFDGVSSAAWPAAAGIRRRPPPRRAGRL